MSLESPGHPRYPEGGRKSPEDFPKLTEDHPKLTKSLQVFSNVMRMSV